MSGKDAPILLFDTKSISEGVTRYVVRAIDYQRNGISGAGFYVVTFRKLHKDGPTLWGIVFNEPKHVAVVDPMDIGSHWRGDQFEEGLREVIKVWEEAR